MTETEAQQVVDTIGQRSVNAPLSAEDFEQLLEAMETIGLIARFDDPETGKNLNVLTEKGKQYTQ